MPAVKQLYIAEQSELDIRAHFPNMRLERDRTTASRRHNG